MPEARELVTSFMFKGSAARRLTLDKAGPQWQHQQSLSSEKV